MYSSIKILTIALFVAFSTFNMQKSNKEFCVYLQENRYNSKTSDLVSRSSNFFYYKYLSIYYIDRENKGIIDYKFVDQGLNNICPKQNDSSLVCLNLENVLYQNLKKFNPGQSQFDTSEKLFIDFVRYVKKKRPNIKVGIYGLPSNFYWKNNDVNTPNKFDKLLKEVDYISPQLYIHYSKDQYGLQDNIKYIKENLDVSLSYGKRLGKPVIPYVWYLVHPSNKKYGKELISQDEMTTYLKTISTYESSNQKAKGVIWWEPSKLDYKISKDNKNSKKNSYTIDDIADQYLSFLLNLKQ